MKARHGYLLTLPAMVLIFIILVFPLFYTIYCSLFNLDYLHFSGYVGLDNYKNLLKDPEIILSFLRTLVITVAASGISLILGLILALWIDRRKGLLAYAIEMIGLVPWVISMVVGALLWRWIFNDNLGIFNYGLSIFNLSPVSLFQSKLGSILLLIFVMAWRTIGYSMVMILAGLKGIPKSLIEATQVDGANWWKILIRVKLPLIKTPMLVSTIVLSMSNFTNNTVPMVLTGGGPGTTTSVITLTLYNMSFSFYKFGMASALSFLIFAVTLVMVILYTRMVKYEI